MEYSGTDTGVAQVINHIYHIFYSDYLSKSCIANCQLWAHEVGHLLGMAHDFVGSGSVRYDSYNRQCTNTGGIMDYYNVSNEYHHQQNTPLHFFPFRSKSYSSSGCIKFAIPLKY